MNLLILLVLFLMLYKVNSYVDSDRLNVGTVLFQQSDANKRCWDASTIDLLEARKYIQNILPSPNLVDAMNDKYVDHLLQYFNHSYDIIKREIEDPVTRNVMKYALSDAIGGYLKSWVVPVSKYSYYGGTVSLDNVLKVTKVYDDIKKELNTDGDSWKKDEKLISYFPIDVASNKRDPRFHEGSCDNIAYYEKSGSEYSVPVPVINWDICPSTMFMPLKSPSLLPLDSTNCSTSLVNYYELIQNCVNNIDNWKDFDDRFQSWLMTDVAPHLSDECLYVPFGGVLGLMNRSKLPGNFFRSLKAGYNKVINSCNTNGMPFFFSGKKVIIAIVIFVELVWCIPALYYVICCKKKKRKRRWSLLFCFKRKTKKNAFYFGTSTDGDTDSERNYSSHSSERCYNTINDYYQPSLYGTRYSNIDTDSQNKLTSSFHQQISHLDRHIESKPLLKPQNSRTKPCDTVETECEQEKKKNIKKSKSQSHKSKQSAPFSEKVLQDINYSQYFTTAEAKRESSVNDTLEKYDMNAREYGKSIQQIQKAQPGTSKDLVSDRTLTRQEVNCKTVHCPCTNNIRDNGLYRYTKPSVLPKKKERKLFKIRKRTIEVRKEEKTMKNEKKSIRKETAPILNNTAHPKTEIKVGISKYKEYTKRIVRPSKIPRFNAAGIKESANESHSPPQKHLPPHWIKVEQAIANEHDILVELQVNDAEKLNVTM